MKTVTQFGPEHGGAGVKFLFIMLALVLFANAGYNYIPVAYEGANFRQDMDTAVVKGLAAPSRVSPIDVVKASIKKAAADNNIPADAYIEIKPQGSTIRAHVYYTKEIDMLPFGLYRYPYEFDHTAVPTGYLLEDSK
jgi:hypothetical protein